MDFKDLFDHNDPEIREAAKLLNEAKEGLESGQLSREQFDELVEDALQIREIDKLADDLERKIATERAISLLKTIISAIPK